MQLAAVRYNQSLKLNPNSPKAHYNLGMALKENGDLDEALVHHLKALELDPHNSNAFMELNSSKPSERSKQQVASVSLLNSIRTIRLHFLS